MHSNRCKGNRVGILSICLLCFTLACDREPGIIVNIAVWPDGVERIRVRASIDDTAGTDILLARDQTRFAVRVPPGSQGTVRLDAVGLDATDCKLASGSFSEPVPDNLSRFAERTLELSQLPTRLCIFANATDLEVDPGPFAVAAGDFDRDTKLDLAVAINATNNVSVLRGNGAGGFGIGSNFPLDSGKGPNSVAVGDFNRDTKLDLAVVGFLSGDVSVFLGDGAGGFDKAKHFSVGVGPQAVAVEDFNRDQNPDLVVANKNTNNVSILLGDGAGGFGAAASFSVGTGPQAVAVGDFNRDQNLDLVTANYASNNITVLLGNGAGRFGSATNPSVGAGPVSVAVGDFNGDTKPDVVVANSLSSDVSVLLGDGVGGFQITNSSVATPPRSVAVGDFNLDMKSDFAIANNNTADVSLLLGDGMGGFRPGGNFVVGANPISVAMGDFNRDGMPDLAVVNYSSRTVSILLNQTSIPGPLW